VSGPDPGHLGLVVAFTATGHGNGPPLDFLPVGAGRSIGTVN
jgi:hypothetical protein